MSKYGPDMKYNQGYKTTDRRCCEHPGPGHERMCFVTVANSSVPAGYCQCGCGQITEKWKRTDRNRGRVAGEHKRFIRGHNGRELGKDYSPAPPCPECGGKVSRRSNSGLCNRCQMRQVGKSRAIPHPPCVVCGKIVPIITQKYCSRACYSEAHVVPKGPEHWSWKGNDVTEWGARGRAQSQVPDGKCEVCGQFPAHRHHVDRNLLNNDASNIQYLCNAHHRQLHAREDGAHTKVSRLG